MPRAARRMTQPFSIIVFWFDNGVLNLSVGMNRQEWCGWNHQLGLWVGHAEPDVGGAAVRSVLGGTVDVAHMEIWSCENFGRLKFLEFFDGWNSFADPGLVRRQRDVGAANMNGKSEGNRMSCGIDGDPLGKKREGNPPDRFAPIFATYLSSFCWDFIKGRGRIKQVQTQVITNLSV